MRTRRRRSLCLAALAALALAAPAWGAEDATLRAAKKEGKVTWYTAVATAVAQNACKIFNEKKLGVTCVVHRDGSGPLYRRILQEAKGGVFVADTFDSANTGHFLSLRKDHLASYKPKGTDKFHPAFVTDHGYWNYYRATVVVPFYNTRKVSEKDAPKSWKDLTDPRWQGKLVQAHPSYSGNITTQIILLEKLLGWGLFEKLAALKPKVQQSSLAGIPIVARGEADAATGSPLYAVLNAIKKGEPLKAVYPPEGVPLNTMPYGVMSKAPNPNAAKVFSDFIFSQEAQQILANQNLYVGHPGVKYPKSLPDLKSLKLLDLAPEEQQKKSKETQDKFRKAFGV